MYIFELKQMCANYNRASREDMAAMASPNAMSPTQGLPPTSDHHVTLMEDPDVWRPT